MNSFEPLRITAYMRTRLIADEYLPFDAFLHFQVHRDKFGAQELTIPGAYSFKNDPHFKLPLAIEHAGEKHWYYKSSWAEWGPHKDYQDHWNKRFDFSLSPLIDFKNKRGVIHVQRGEHKAYHMTVFCRSTLWIRWYCVGNKKEIEALLSTMTNIGKKYAQGEGRVARWEVTQIDDDFSVWKDGKLMRGIPIQDVKDNLKEIGKDNVSIVKYGIRPSYWNSQNQMPIVLP